MRRTFSIITLFAVLAGIGTAAAAGRTGQQVYESFCKACHGTGAAGAPKFGDKAWLHMEKKEGMKELVKDAIKGERAMPPKGGCADCTEDEIRAAVQYLVDSAKKK